MRLYEGMFVIDSTVADRSYDEVCAEIESIITKHGGSIVDLRKWDERRLAYEINRARRGTYLLIHFEMPPEAMSELRRDFVLSEKILRQILLVDTDGVPTGEERPGITTSISEASHRRRLSRPVRTSDQTSGDEGKDGPGDEKAADVAEEASAEEKTDAVAEEANAEEKADAVAEEASVDAEETSEEAEASDDGAEDDTGKDA